MLVPLSYNLRSLLVRRTASVLTLLGIGATVAVLAGVLALRQGFSSLYAAAGQEGVAVLLRRGSMNEGDSSFARQDAQELIKTLPELARGPDGAPLGSMEVYGALRLPKRGGGEANVPIRGVQPATFAIREGLRVVAGRGFRPGHDEVIVGARALERVRGVEPGDVIQLNTTPFRVVGVFELDGPLESEIWGDLERMLVALQRPGPNRVLARLAPDADVRALAARLAEHREVPAKVLTEAAYLASQTEMLATVLGFLGAFLGGVMGLAAIFTATTTMLAALASRTNEIGVLLALGYRPLPIFLSFLFESLVIGLAGGLVGCLIAWPLDGLRTGTTNFQTFTEVGFAFQLTPSVLATAVAFALGLGLLGGAWPAWRAARLTPTEALRRR